VKAKFICSGYHWLKTLPWRIETWLKMDRGEMPPAARPPNITACLGWTQEQVDELRARDLARHHREVEETRAIEEEVQMGIAEIRYWTADLSELAQYGYSGNEIAEYERRMNSR